MAARLDAHTQADVGSAATSFNIAHSPVGTPRGVLILVIQNTATGEQIADGDVAYGGVNVPRVGTYAKVTDETGRVYAFFRGDSIPTGNQNATGTITSPAGGKRVRIITLTGGADLELVDENGAEGRLTWPQVTLATLSGFDGFVASTIHSGLNAPSSINLGEGGTGSTVYTELGTGRDFGNQSEKAQYWEGALGADVIADYPVGTSDFALIAVAIAEATSTDRMARVSFAELEVPTAPRQARVSYAELEVPSAPRQARVSYAELEVPTAPRQARVSYAELEVPTAPRQARVAWAELEVPDVAVTDRQARVSYAEFEVPTAPRSARVSFAELEAPNAPRSARVSYAELEVPTAPRQARISYVEFEVPTAPRRAYVSFAELEVPENNDRAAFVSFAELEVPTAPRGAQVVWAEMELPDAGHRMAAVSYVELEVPNGPRAPRVSWAELETPDDPGPYRAAQFVITGGNLELLERELKKRGILLDNAPLSHYQLWDLLQVVRATGTQVQFVPSEYNPEE